MIAITTYDLQPAKIHVSQVFKKIPNYVAISLKNCCHVVSLVLILYDYCTYVICDPV